MNDVAFKNGILCGLLATGIGIGGDSSGNKLPLPEVLEIINLSYYDNVITYLSEFSYTTLLSSSFSYMPSQGYVMIGGYDLYDFEGDDGWSSPEADIKITVDGKVVYEGDSAEFFDYDVSFAIPKTFQYKTNFEFAARRRNMSNDMQMQLRDTMIVGIR